MDINIWRVGHNSYGNEVSLDTSSFETFKRDPIESFAREIVQNSIDAKKDNEEKVVVEFKTFEINYKDIPDHNMLKNGLYNQLDNWKNKSKKKKNDLRRMKEMYDLFDGRTIKCMRVSDFNTIGLKGVESNDETSPFYVLTKGEGVSFKGETMGGSKGIGKYAAFGVSKIHTIFYSTLTEDGNEGHIGSARLASGYYLNPKTGEIEDKKLKTNGIWYYGSNDMNEPIKGQLHLDKSFKRNENEYGTDLYIMGFAESNDWKNNIVAKILESFMVAIVYGELEVIVEDIIINKENIETLINSLNLRQNSISYKVIKSTYELLTEDDVYENNIDIKEHGIVNVLVKGYSSKDSNQASKRCVIVRHPYMRIQDITGISQLPFSALAIIRNNDLNKKLRKFENPEHTEWQFRRTDYTENETKEARELYNELKNVITENVRNALFRGDSTELDAEGAGEYLPAEDSGGIANSKEKIIVENRIIHKPRKQKNIDQRGYLEDEHGNSLNPDTGDPIDEEGENYGENPGTGQGKNRTINHIKGDSSTGLQRKKLAGIRYHLIAINSKEGEYIIKFKHYENVNDCDLEIKIIGDSITDKFDLKIFKAKVNGENAKIIDNRIIGFDILSNINNEISITTDQKEMFSGEVTIYASR